MSGPTPPRTASGRRSTVTPLSDEMLVAGEFAAVYVCVVRQGHGVRLRLRDQETGAVTTLDPLDLQSLCLADADEQRAWLRVGAYRPDPTDPTDGGPR